MTTKKNNQGFKEDVDPLTGKRNIHCIAAEKGKFKKQNVSKASAIDPVLEAEDIITLRFDNSEELAEPFEQFEEDNDVELVIRKEGDEIFVDVPVENSADFIDFLAENDIKVKEDVKPEKTNDEVVDVKTTVKSVLDKKSTEKSLDNVKSAEKVANTGKKDGVNSSVSIKTEVDKIIAEAQISWLKPELASVDTAKAE
jgi:hypothetical protein